MLEPLRALRPTTRGLLLLAGGTATVAAGIGIGVPPLVQAGLVVVLAVLVGGVSVAVDVLRSQRRAVRVTRAVLPHPVVVGDRATVVVEVHGRAGLDRARLSERAARELSGGRPLRAKVTRSAGQVSLRYEIEPERRGRWSAGPLEVHLRDVLGTVAWSGVLGAARRVAVRPRITPLTMPGGAAALDTRASSGSRSPAPDDAALRDYRPGDDPRRVHWRSTARRGELVVRQDEHAGRRPATVLVDLPMDPGPLEWVVATGASLAVALVGSGHRVRMLAGPEPQTRHLADGEAVESVLDAAVDLVAPPSRAARRAWLSAGATDLTSRGAGSELLVAVLGELEGPGLVEVARLGVVHEAWAMVLASPSPTTGEERTLRALRRAGWAAVLVRSGEPADRAWHRLLEAAAPARSHA